MQQSLGSDLDPTYLAIVTDLVTYSTSQGATLLLDVHNYARYAGAVIGSTDSGAPTAAQFGDLWSKLATLFKDNPKVVFGLMNEPNGMTTELWLADANAAIAAIRQTGATNVITVPGNGYTGAHSWTTGGYGTPNSTVMLGVVDPAKNFIYEVHQYLDEDSSGTHDTCDAAPAGAQSLMAFTAWAKTNGVRAMLGEFGAANNATCLTDLDGFLGYIDQNRDVFAGWTYWSAGPWWGTYMFSIEPSSSGADAPQMATLLQHL
jgi:endoglucanase